MWFPFRIQYVPLFPAVVPAAVPVVGGGRIFGGGRVSGLNQPCLTYDGRYGARELPAFFHMP